MQHPPFFFNEFHLHGWSLNKKLIDFSFIQSAVTCLCFAPTSEQIITASKDGSIRVWNINGMLYFLTSCPYVPEVICLTWVSFLGVTMPPFFYIFLIYHMSSIRNVRNEEFHDEFSVGMLGI